MKLSTKIVLATGAAVVLTAVGGCVTVYLLAARNRLNALHQQMSVVLRQAETVAERMDQMHRDKAFDTAGLIAAAKVQGGGRPLHEIYRDTAFYNTIPIVASWQAAEKAAHEQGYAFFTPSRPDLPARNPKNDNGADFAAAFKAFAGGATEYFVHDTTRNELLLARPVRMERSCLNCHGDPAHSPSGDGKDVLGFPMEGLQLGDIKGAFVLRAPMSSDVVVAHTVRTMALVSGALLLVSAAAFYAFARRFINRPLAAAIADIEQSCAQTTHTAAQIATSSHKLADGSSQQAAALEESSASLEEISSMTKRNAESAAEATQMANQAKAMADTGADKMAAMQQAIESMHTANTEIANILKHIDEIALQTNILALNAAIEAARAGEAGAGFAVVADEVRRLAQRCADAARETAGKTEHCLNSGRRGIEISADAAQSFAAIRSRVLELDAKVTEIATASREQSQGLDQVAIAVSQIDKVTQTNAATSEESSAVATELNHQASDLQSAVRKLHRVMDDHAAAPAAPVLAAAGIDAALARPRDGAMRRPFIDATAAARAEVLASN